MSNSKGINSVKIENYGMIEDFSFQKFGGLNLIIGENGTGKTFLLKALYSAMKTIEDYQRGDDVRKISGILSERLRWTFQADKLGNLVKKGSNDALSFYMKLDEKSFSYNFKDSASIEVSSIINEIEPREAHSVFIPAKEVLSLYGIIMKSREIDKVFGFDDTYYDLVKALQIAPSKGRNYTTFSEARKALEHMIDGRVEFDDTTNKWFYRKGKQKFNITITSEGVKKIAILDRLLGNGYLSKSSILFIDDLESALHPSAISDFLEIIESIAFDMGIQVFIASHSYFVIKKMYIIAQKRNCSIPCISMNKNGNIGYYDFLDGMPDNSIIKESISLYEEEIEEALGL